MTSKTFKSHSELAKTISVTRSQGRVLVEIEDPKHLIAINVSDTDAPALALAILEAAGVKPVGYPGNSTITLGSVVGDLALVIAEQERATAEARERAELEAEALELRNEYFDKECAWSDINDVGQALWLRMARKARELAKEATK